MAPETFVNQIESIPLQVFTIRSNCFLTSEDLLHAAKMQMDNIIQGQLFRSNFMHSAISFAWEREEAGQKKEILFQDVHAILWIRNTL